jgi:hypothetical protein
MTVDYLACEHFSGHRGGAWCRLLDGHACPVAWKSGACVKASSFDADAFRTWAEAKRYSDTTITNAIRKVKRALTLGIARAEDVDALYPGLTNGSKNSMRTVMRMFQDFQQQTGRSV